MICSHCGRFLRDNVLTCEFCGAFLPENAENTYSGTSALKQGRSYASEPELDDPRANTVHEYGDYDASAVPMGHSVQTSDQHGHNRRQSYGAHPVSSMGAGSRPSDHSGSAYGSHGPVSMAPRHPIRAGHRIKGPKKSHTNWILILLILCILGAGAAGGYYYYAKKSDSGQRSTARKIILASTEDDFATITYVGTDPEKNAARTALAEKWGDVDAEAYWDVAQDYLGVGDMAAAITGFRIADYLDPENYDGLLLLANAYELNMQDDMAETIYLNLIDNIAPSRSDAYSNLISLYKDTGREQQAADMMLKAYTNTGRDTFRQQRNEFIPAIPMVDLTAGRYEMNESGLRATRMNEFGDVVPITQLIISSPQGYDVYYTTDKNAVLPEEGIYVSRISNNDGSLGYTGIHLKEGTLTIRAVAVSGNLHSDELNVSYNFFYPAPPAPKTNLQSGTYKRLQKVKLRPGTITDSSLTRAEKAEAESHYRYYYTIDGSMPTTNSPEYKGEEILLPTGRVTLRAICVNQYGKTSSVMEIGYKFNVTPYLPAVWEEKDTFSGFTLNKTTMEQFTAEFGQPTEKMDTTYYQMSGNCTHLSYPWGYAVFNLVGTRWQLVRVEMNKHITAGPRGADFGNTEEQITSLFRDYGQAPNQDTSRGLYYSYPDVGQIILRDDGTRVIQYQLQNASSNTWYLEFWLKNGKVNKICHYYVP